MTTQFPYKMELYTVYFNNCFVGTVVSDGDFGNSVEPFETLFLMFNMGFCSVDDYVKSLPGDLTIDDVRVFNHDTFSGDTSYLLGGKTWQTKSRAGRFEVDYVRCVSECDVRYHSEVNDDLERIRLIFSSNWVNTNNMMLIIRPRKRLIATVRGFDHCNKADTWFCCDWKEADIGEES